MKLKALIALFCAVCYNNVFAQTSAQCLYSVMYYESNMEPIEGQKAVLEVVFNRAREYDKSVCQVVKQKGQFSWVGHKPFIAMTAQRARKLIDVQEQNDVVGDKVLYFYNTTVKPKWAKKMLCKRIGGHNFCRERR